MIFSLKIPIAKTNQTIDYQSDLLLLGSCFSENIGNKFSYFKFKTTVNPFGIIFNPISIEKIIKGL
ncbi:GSCFA domain-containing protein [Flavobacterium davisii]|uniref:GSCFA domain-containing protein n=1 Tax=Flavobacterium davisii TaxID=2906077 RepID=UPI002869C11E|nr:GSCFA domain-containing protein [Flavobacterium davisii]